MHHRSRPGQHARRLDDDIERGTAPLAKVSSDRCGKLSDAVDRARHGMSVQNRRATFL
jgi:hypothetical protein